MANPYDVPVTILVRVGDSEPVEVARGGVPVPYDMRDNLKRLFSEVAERLKGEDG